MPIMEIGKPIIGGAIGFFGASLLHRFGLSNLPVVKDFPEVSDGIVMVGAYFGLKGKPDWKIPVFAGASISLVDHLLTRAGIRV